MSGVVTKEHKEFRHLFSGRHKALPIDGYLKAAYDYVHLNLPRAKPIAPEEPLSSFPWSTFPLGMVKSG